MTMGPVITLMMGRLEDWLRVLTERDGVVADPTALPWSGVAVFKRAVHRVPGARPPGSAARRGHPPPPPLVRADRRRRRHHAAVGLAAAFQRVRGRGPPPDRRPGRPGDRRGARALTFRLRPRLRARRALDGDSTRWGRRPAPSGVHREIPRAAPPVGTRSSRTPTSRPLRDRFAFFLYRPAGSLSADGPWSTWLTPEDAGWRLSPAWVSAIMSGRLRAIPGRRRLGRGHRPAAVGVHFDVVVDAGARAPRGVPPRRARESVWAGPTDFVFAPPEHEAHGHEHGRETRRSFAHAIRPCRAPLSHPGTSRQSAVAIELRGAGASSREVRNFATAGHFDADRLIAVEVLSPGRPRGWVSTPQARRGPGGQGKLEEIYHYVVADGPTGPGLAYQHVYGTPDHPIDLLDDGRHRRYRAGAASLARAGDGGTGI